MTQTATTLGQITQSVKNAFKGLNGNKTVIALLIVVSLLIVALCLCNTSSREYKITDSDYNAQPSQPISS